MDGAGLSGNQLGGRVVLDPNMDQQTALLLDDGELVALAKAGRGQAFDELIRRHQDIAFGVAVVYLGDPETAADAAQEAMIKAYRALHRFDTSRPFRPWLLRIVANQARDALKSRRRREGFTVYLGDFQPRAGGRTVEDMVVADDEQQRLATGLNGLRPEERRVIAMRYFVGLSEGEMAEALNCRRGTVKSRLSRALSHLRLVLEPEAAAAQEVTVNA
jgi:RNA polymerase sigma-70 factor, ECF subfamily